MSNKHHYVAIMAGGIGSRFWPMSRTAYPKQFLDVLNTGKTLIQWTYERYAKFIPDENIFIVTSEEYVGIVKEQLPNLPLQNILAEPSRKNTAPCIAYISFKLAQLDPDAVFVVAPSDHLILEEEAFQQTALQALDFVENIKSLVTLGIKPTHPNTGYGYIQYEGHEVANGVYKVKTFTEKPNLELAEAFMESGDYVWNAGLFVFAISTFKHELTKHLSRLAEQFEEGRAFYYTDQEATFIKKVYAVCKSISMDNGVMEKAREVKVILADIGWSDLGTWKSLHEINEKDEKQNAVDANVMLYETEDCIIKAPKDKLVVIHGLSNYIVAEHGNVLMICPKDQEQQVKQFVEDATKLDSSFS